MYSVAGELSFMDGKGEIFLLIIHRVQQTSGPLQGDMHPA